MFKATKLFALVFASTNAVYFREDQANAPSVRFEIDGETDPNVIKMTYTTGPVEIPIETLVDAAEKVLWFEIVKGDT